jgi:hypothetical protein
LLVPRTIGDGTNHVTAVWSLAAADFDSATPDSAFFYGASFFIPPGNLYDVPEDTEVAIAVGVTDINQITDASIFDFTSDHTIEVDPVGSPGVFLPDDFVTAPASDADGPLGTETGQFLVFRNINTGHYGALRIDDIYDPHQHARRIGARMDATWWFQTNGTANFSSQPACPADFNSSGSISVQDIFDFLGAYFTNLPAADFNHSGMVTVQDIFDFLTAYFVGC